MILPIIEYGAQFILQANQQYLRKLDTIHHTGLRICTGAHRTTPTNSLYHIGNNHPLRLKLEEKLKNLTAKTLGNNCTTTINKIGKGPKQRYPTSLSKGIQELSTILKEVNIKKTPQLKNPFWTKKTQIDTELHKYKKINTPETIYKKLLAEKFEIQYKDHTKIYTDASKKDEKVGIGITHENSEYKIRLKDNTNIHTAELIAILHALKNITTRQRNILICTDSLSAIESIKRIEPDNPIAVEIINEIQGKANKNITILWVPSHKNILYNEKADKLAKDALEGEIDNRYNEHTVQDIKRINKRSTEQNWNKIWRSDINNKLRAIKPATTKWEYNTAIAKYLQDKLNRTRTGHTRLTHDYILQKTLNPTCRCNDHLTIQHLFEDCPATAGIRRQLGVNMDTLTREDPMNNKKTITFLRRIDVIAKI